MTRLCELQRRFAEAVRGAEIGEALDVLVAGRNARAGLDVYRTSYVARLHEALRDDYPKVAAVLGDGFLQLARAYVDAHPSDHPSLRHFGRYLPAFLESTGRAPPWLAELARLEWARIEAFDAADAAPMPLEALRAVSAEHWPTLRLVPVPSLRVIRLAWNVADVWAALEDDRAPPDLEPELTTIAVWRAGFIVRHRACPLTEARAVALLQGLAPFSAVCDAFGDSSSNDVDAAAGRAFAALAQWVADEWITAFPRPDGHAIAARPRE